MRCPHAGRSGQTQSDGALPDLARPIGGMFPAPHGAVCGTALAQRRTDVVRVPFARFPGGRSPAPHGGSVLRLLGAGALFLSVAVGALSSQPGALSAAGGEGPLTGQTPLPKRGTL